MSADVDVSVTVTSPSRLHFTLIDLNGELGRVDAGIGVALNEPSLKIKVSPLDSESASKAEEESENPVEVLPILKRIRERIEPELKCSYKVEILRALPHHVGLGSRTQLSLSVAKAISVLEHRDFTTYELAKLVGRGGTSGIGTAAFDHGGFILDGGHLFRRGGGRGAGVKHSFLPSSASEVPPPPVLFQHPLPEDWFFVLAIPHVKRGAHGSEEIEIFKRNCPIRATEVEKLCRLILMRILPSVIEGDIYTFGESLSMIQQIGFKKIEIGLQHHIIRELFDFFATHALGYGMSSFGPATYGIVKGESRARELAQRTYEFMAERHVAGSSSVFYSNVNNKGGVVNYF